MFEIQNTGTVAEPVYTNTPTTLVSFVGPNGFGPEGLIADANGDLFSTTKQGGAYGEGTVFEIAGSGFIPPQVLAGTPGQANCLGESVSGLARKYGDLAHAATALGYSVLHLQTEIVIYCGG